MSKPFLATLLLVAAAGVTVGPTACSFPDRHEDVGQSAAALDPLTDARPKLSVVISAIYAGGGTGGSTFKRDFVELFNQSKSDISLNGASLQYSGGDEEFGGAASDLIFPITGTIKAGSYILVALSPTSGGGGAADPPAPDINAVGTATLQLSEAKGQIALVVDTNKPGCGTSFQPCTTNAKVVDYVGWGLASDREGTALQPLSVTKGAVRKGKGCTDNNNNATDFDTPDPITAPRNSQTTPAVDCTPVTPPRDSGGPVPPVVDPELGEESPFSEAKRRDAGSGSSSSGASSSSCTATSTAMPSPFALLALAGAAVFFASRRRR
jgi:MYXO-CTERM domain-containing protein